MKIGDSIPLFPAIESHLDLGFTIEKQPKGRESEYNEVYKVNEVNNLSDQWGAFVTTPVSWLRHRSIPLGSQPFQKDRNEEAM